MRTIPVIQQSDPTECGLACLCMALNAFGRKMSLSQLRNSFSTSFRGLTLRQMIEVAQANGIEATALRIEPDDLRKMSGPVILHWDLKHFVLMVRNNRRHVWLHDPAFGERKISWKTLSDSFTGFALELRPKSGFQQDLGTPTVASVANIWRLLATASRDMAVIAGLSFVLQLLTMGLPLFTQLLIDDILLRGRADLLTMAFVAFGVVALLTVMTLAVRGLFSISLGTNLSMELMNWLVYRLLRLRINFFEARSSGDILSRLTPIRQVQRTLTEGVVIAIVEGVMAVVLLLLMSFYNIWASLVVILCTCVKLGFTRWAGKGIERHTTDASVAGARESALLIESVRNIIPIRIFRVEQQMQNRWVGFVHTAMLSGQKVAHLNLSVTAFTEAISLFQAAIVLGLGALAVTQQEMTVGMLVAFMAFMGQFNAKIIRLEGAIVDFTTISAHLGRIEDIIAEPMVQTKSSYDTSSSNPLKVLELRSCSFRYAPHLPWVLQDVSLRLEAGETIGIVGSSGVGKTTLLSLVLGLRAPETGLVLVNGTPISLGTRDQGSSSMACVLQGETPFAASILENITLFADTPDREQVAWAIAMACLDEDIARLPMGLDTTLGEAGVGLSAGQRQRLLIARCLYRRPSLLILDEATANLDPALESRIIDNLAQSGIPCLIVAHRQGALRRCHRVYEIKGAGLRLVSS
jgi:ATP-binding cassette, subfamily B, bacterial CvaB/MchF/RaxB